MTIMIETTTTTATIVIIGDQHQASVVCSVVVSILQESSKALACVGVTENYNIPTYFSIRKIIYQQIFPLVQAINIICIAYLTTIIMMILNFINLYPN